MFLYEVIDSPFLELFGFASYSFYFFALSFLAAFYGEPTFLKSIKNSCSGSTYYFNLIFKNSFLTGDSFSFY